MELMEKLYLTRKSLRSLILKTAKTWPASLNSSSCRLAMEVCICTVKILRTVTDMSGPEVIKKC